MGWFDKYCEKCSYMWCFNVYDYFRQLKNYGKKELSCENTVQKAKDKTIKMLKKY